MECFFLRKVIIKDDLINCQDIKPRLSITYNILCVKSLCIQFGGGIFNIFINIYIQFHQVWFDGLMIVYANNFGINQNLYYTKRTIVHFYFSVINDGTIGTVI